MARPYEAVYIFDSALEEAAINEKLSRFHSLVAQPDGDQPRVNHWGKRTLAYPIRKRETGYYVVANFQTDAAQLPEFERAIKLDDGVLRHLVVLDEFDYTPTRAPADRKEEEEEEE
jgi:small subunit ribosomal protein S6